MGCFKDAKIVEYVSSSELDISVQYRLVPELEINFFVKKPLQGTTLRLLNFIGILSLNIAG